MHSEKPVTEGNAGKSATGPRQGQGDAALHALFERIFWGDMELSPIWLTRLGLDTGAHGGARSRLDALGTEGDAARTRHARDMLGELQAIDPRGLSETGAIRHAVVADMLEQRLVSDQFGLADIVSPYRLSQQDGAYFAIPDFLDSGHPVENASDAEAYLARLAAFPAALDDQGEAQRADAARGYLAPGWSLDLVASQIEALLEPAARDSGMVRSLASRAEQKGVAGDWAARAAQVVEGEVYPALRRQLELVRQLRPGTLEGDGVWRVPRGDEIYARALRQNTTTDQSAEEIHRTGLEQVAELSAELDTILKDAGLTRGTVGERLNELGARPDQLFANDEAGAAALLEALRDGFDAMQARMAHAFATPPGQPIEIRRVPEEIQDGAPAGYYKIAAIDGSRPATYWINLSDTGDWPKFTLPALTYHEAEPGHHLHLSLVQQDADLPLLLKSYWLSAYGEGWALYAEQLADELGGYEGVEMAGALQSWLFRAARLVVDTGIHTKRWSREQATQYMFDTVAFTPLRSLREVERYCVMPGQACSYKVGHNVWRAARARAESELGESFDLRQFHEILREGVMPLALFEQRVDAWIERARAA